MIAPNRWPPCDDGIVGMSGAVYQFFAVIEAASYHRLSVRFARSIPLLLALRSIAMTSPTPNAVPRPFNGRRKAAWATIKSRIALLGLVWLSALPVSQASAQASQGAQAAQTASAPLASQDDVNDPLEPVNRAIFWFNEGVDVVLIKPAAQLYRWALPNSAQKGVRNVLRNLRSPLDFTNQLLQGDTEGASVVFRRFIVNTTLGVGGIIDVAHGYGLDYEYESLEQTLAVWGVPEGPYLVLPLFGPSTLRDALALGGETVVDPVARYTNAHDQEWVTLARGGLYALDTRAGYLEALDDVKRNSFDYYASMRSLYRQRRDGWIRDGQPDTSSLPDIPDYEE
jgi:phospholipid-binding lipoprotein MlaA